MISIYCDRCKNEIKKSFMKGISDEHLQKQYFNEESWHICPDCYNSFLDWRDVSKQEGVTE